MSVFQPTDLLPGPQMLSVAFSLTGAATADTAAEFRQTLGKLGEALDGFRVAVDNFRHRASALKTALPDYTPAQLRSALDMLLAAEQEGHECILFIDAVLGKNRSE